MLSAGPRGPRQRRR